MINIYCESFMKMIGLKGVYGGYFWINWDKVQTGMVGLIGYDLANLIFLYNFVLPKLMVW